jgi:hypothetical protein
MTIDICDVLEKQLKRLRNEFWWLTPNHIPLPGEYIVTQACGRFYESCEEHVTKRRKWLIKKEGTTPYQFCFDGEARILYVGSLTDEDEIVLSWLHGEDIEHGKRPVPREPVV